MKYKHQSLLTDLDSFGTFFNLGLEDTNQVYMSCDPNFVGIGYYNLTDNSAGCAYINIPLPYAQCTQIKDLNIAPADSNSFNEGYKIWMYINQKTKKFKIDLEAMGGDTVTLASNGDPLVGEYETHRLRIDWRTANYDKPGIVIGYTDRALRLNMRTGSDIYLYATEYMGNPYTTSLVGYNIVDYSFSTENEEVMIQQLSSEINVLDTRVALIEDQITSLTGQVTNTFVSR